MSATHEAAERLGFSLRLREGKAFHETRFVEYVKNRVLRRQTLGEEDDAQGHWVQETA